MLKVKYSQINIDEDVLAVDKPKGWSSHDVVAKIRGELKNRFNQKIKVGHGGSLDPLATGLLLVLIGRAVKRFEEIKDWHKEYVVEIEFGKATETGDSGGKVVKKLSTSKVESKQVEEAVKSFKGEFDQEIPMYSAKKFKGQKLYQLARKGKKIKPIKKRVEIFKIQVLNLQGLTLKVRVVCSGGTFMRQLAVDIGKKLELPAYAKSIRRIRIGKYRLS